MERSRRSQKQTEVGSESKIRIPKSRILLGQQIYSTSERQRRGQAMVRVRAEPKRDHMPALVSVGILLCTFKSPSFTRVDSDIEFTSYPSSRHEMLKILSCSGTRTECQGTNRKQPSAHWRPAIPIESDYTGSRLYSYKSVLHSDLER